MNNGKTTLAKFEEFFSVEYNKQLVDVLSNYPNQRSIIVDYLDLEMFDSDLSELLIERSDEVINAAEKAIKNIVFQKNKQKVNINVRFSNVANEADIKELGSKYIGKLVSCKGIIENIEEIEPRICVATFECRGCMRLHELTQTINTISEPTLCPECGSRSFRLLQDESEFVDNQSGIIKTENYDPHYKNEILFIMEDDLVGTLLKNEKAMLTGILRVHREKGKNLTYFYVNYCEPLEQHMFEDVGDVVTDYDEVDPTSRSSPEYQAWKKAVLSRDGYECKCCGLKKHLHVHHMHGYKENPSLRLDEGNGITLCQFCHDKYHSVYGVTDINPAKFADFMRRFSTK